jgi:hypothetical protein
MSRTYRRTDSRARPERHAALRQLVQSHGHWTWINLDPHSPEGRVRLARFHADNAGYRRSAPRWYCALFNRADRRGVNQGLVRWWRRNDHDALLTDRHRHSASWAWW